MVVNPTTKEFYIKSNLYATIDIARHPKNNRWYGGYSYSTSLSGSGIPVSFNLFNDSFSSKKDCMIYFSKRIIKDLKNEINYYRSNLAYVTNVKKLIKSVNNELSSQSEPTLFAIL